ncbi:hypothetical protein ABBQ38_002174 [Trebouxia sp. C0009 RCD-2024]
MLGDAQAAQLLLSCSGAAFAANTGLNRAKREGFLAGKLVKEEGRPGQEGSFSRSARQVSASPECSESAPNIPFLAGSPTSATGSKRHTINHPTPAKRTVKSAQPQQDMHPVLKLGYRTMCEVHCNGLQGLFLGGHDRDLYIQCTSHEYADLPLVDANQGGCIMSCSHFERAAGRELSKKWKESIHVVGEGEGSKATLLAWLKRQAEAMSPDIVGSHVWVCWCNEADFYHGTILSFNRESGKHKVRYSDRFVEELHLPVEKLDFGQAKPQLQSAEAGTSQAWPPIARPLLQQDSRHGSPHAVMSTSIPSSAQGCGETCGTASVQAAAGPTGHAEPLPYHLLHQSSGTSAASGLTEHQAGLRHINTRKRANCITAASPRTSSGQHQPITPGRGRRSGRAALACNESLQESGDGLSGVSHNTHIQADIEESTMPAVPKRLRTGLREPQALRHAVSVPVRNTDGYCTSPLAGLASLATATSLAMGAPPCLGPHPSLDSHQLSTSRVFGPPLLGSLSSVQQMTILSPPPPGGLQETDMAVMSCWMNKVALQLDDVLVDGVHVLAEPITVAGMVLGSGLRHAAQQGSPSARFQNLLIHARSRGSVQGYYEAMLTRYDHFRDKPAALLVKMAEFIMAALTDYVNKQYCDAIHDQHRLPDTQT